MERNSITLNIGKGGQGEVMIRPQLEGNIGGEVESTALSRQGVGGLAVDKVDFGCLIMREYSWSEMGGGGSGGKR
jgi:hypothetical protein